MKLIKINYANLNPRQKEIFNYQKVSGHLSDYGFNCIKLSDDWHGADFLAYHKDGVDTLKVQLKSCVTICRKYFGKNLFIAFPVRGNWYLVEHDLLVKLIGQHTPWLGSKSWLKVPDGKYHSSSPGKVLLQSLSDFKL